MYRNGFTFILPVVDIPSKTHWLAKVAVLFSERTTPHSYTLLQLSVWYFFGIFVEGPLQKINRSG